jgi:hypothetical protein
MLDLARHRRRPPTAVLSTGGSTRIFSMAECSSLHRGDARALSLQRVSFFEYGPATRNLGTAAQKPRISRGHPVAWSCMANGRAL